MFCSSLRFRPEWAPVVPALSRANTGWKEVKLDGWDVTLQEPFDESSQVFRLLLMTSDELDGARSTARIERLRHLDGGYNVGIVLLLIGDQAMLNFAKLQLELLTHGDLMPIVPILDCAELPACLADWRRQLTNTSTRSRPPETPKALIPHCVHGPLLTERQVNILMDVCSGFRELARNVHDPDKVQMMADFLGQKDAERVTDFFKGGPRRDGF